MTIVTEFDRKRTQEFRLWLAGSIFSGAGSVGWFLWTKNHRIDQPLDIVVFIVLLLVFVFTTWRVDSMAACRSYCPDEPKPKE